MSLEECGAGNSKRLKSAVSKESESRLESKVVG